VGIPCLDDDRQGACGPQATVKEALWFSARLRLGPEISNAECGHFISEVCWLALHTSRDAEASAADSRVIEGSEKPLYGYIACRRHSTCLQVMGLVELTPLARALVGLPGVSGLSVEQRKRLTIAVELVANPAVVFMDEPTSGAAAAAAAALCYLPLKGGCLHALQVQRHICCFVHRLYSGNLAPDQPETRQHSAVHGEAGSR